MKQEITNELINARTLAGFRDILPATEIIKESMLDKIRKVFKKYGFLPIETPHLEFTEVLIGKGSDEINKQLYRFNDNGGRDVTLRFDHTVPLARFVVQNKDKISFPFKRYAIGNVFRGESPRAGRYREFTQCDFDYIGTYSLAADAEIIQVMADSMTSLGIKSFTIFINNRKVLNGLCEYLGVFDKVVEILIWVDKINKIGLEEVRKGLIDDVRLDFDAATEIIEFINIRQIDYPTDFFEIIEKYKSYNDLMRDGILELEYLFNILKMLPINEKNFAIDFSIARGLGYYTGIIYETILNQLPQIGSVCSGGRFDNLTKSFSDDNLPGVGASIGLDRLLAALEKLELINMKSTTADVLVANLDHEYIPSSMLFAHKLRQSNINVEVYPEAIKLGKQFNFASNKGHNFLIAYGEIEAKMDNYTVSDMRTGEKFKGLTFEQVIQKIHHNN